MRLTDCDVLLSSCMFSVAAGVVVLVFLTSIVTIVVLTGWHIWKLYKELKDD